MRAVILALHVYWLEDQPRALGTYILGQGGTKNDRGRHFIACVQAKALTEANASADLVDSRPRFFLFLGPTVLDDSSYSRDLDFFQSCLEFSSFSRRYLA
jgi:hypothetical protein